MSATPFENWTGDGRVAWFKRAYRSDVMLTDLFLTRSPDNAGRRWVWCDSKRMSVCELRVSISLRFLKAWVRSSIIEDCRSIPPQLLPHEQNLHRYCSRVKKQLAGAGATRNLGHTGRHPVGRRNPKSREGRPISQAAQFPRNVHRGARPHRFPRPHQIAFSPVRASFLPGALETTTIVGFRTSVPAPRS